MIVLLDGLPEESRVASHPSGGWTMHTELLAQVIEEISLLAADRRRPEPLSIPRPFATDSGVLTENTPAQQPAPLNGHRKMLAAATRRGMVRLDV